MRYILILLIFNISIQLSAQEIEDSLHLSIQGKVISGKYNIPLEGSSVSIVGMNIGAISDSLGIFVIKNLEKGEYNVEFRDIRFGYLDTLIELNEKSIENLNIFMFARCISINADTAKSDIQKGNPELLLVGRIAPVEYPRDKEFEKKYDIEYYDFGCVVPGPDECIIEYNNVIFEYLDDKFGKEWRKEVRKDVIGFE